MSDKEYEVIEESIETVNVGNHKVALIKARYPNEARLNEYKWHAFCVEYFDEPVYRDERVKAVQSSFYVAAAKAVDAYCNSRPMAEKNE